MHHANIIKCAVAVYVLAFFSMANIVPAHSKKVEAPEATERCQALVDGYEKLLKPKYKKKIFTDFLHGLKAICAYKCEDPTTAVESFTKWIEFLGSGTNSASKNASMIIKKKLSGGPAFDFVTGGFDTYLKALSYTPIIATQNERRKVQSFVKLLRKIKACHDEKIGFLWDPTGTSKQQVFVSRVAVQNRDECVATTYYFTETKVTVTETAAGGGVAEPVPGEHPGDGVPECPKKKPPVVTAEPPKSPPAEKPDLGLVKATEKVVTLALKGEQSGTAYEGAAVKLLAEPPPLPVAGKTPDAALTAAEVYASDLSAGSSGKDGKVTIGLAPAGAKPGGQAKGKPTPKITLSEVKVSDEPKARLAITMKAADTGAPGGKPKLPASLAQPDANLCVDHSFRIGDHVTFVASLNKSRVEDVRRKIEKTEGIYFVEDDPCRTKEGRDVPHNANRAE